MGISQDDGFLIKMNINIDQHTNTITFKISMKISMDIIDFFQTTENKINLSQDSCKGNPLTIERILSKAVEGGCSGLPFPRACNLIRLLQIKYVKSPLVPHSGSKTLGSNFDR